MMVYLKMDEATAKSMEIQVFLTSAAGLSYLSFGIKTWVISKFAEDLGLNVDTYRGVTIPYLGLKIDGFVALHERIISNNF